MDVHEIKRNKQWMLMRKNDLATNETNALKLVIFIPSVAIIKSKVVILHLRAQKARRLFHKVKEAK